MWSNEMKDLNFTAPVYFSSYIAQDWPDGGTLHSFYSIELSWIRNWLISLPVSWTDYRGDVTKREERGVDFCPKR
jgi:hypothetical protein